MRRLLTWPLQATQVVLEAVENTTTEIVTLWARVVFTNPIAAALLEQMVEPEWPGDEEDAR